MFDLSLQKVFEVNAIMLIVQVQSHEAREGQSWDLNKNILDSIAHAFSSVESQWW